ncbi:MAG TPA: MFS transporter [Acidobacteriaceae bacterium]|nr:MFS transporter [Acidobacteriaceae bacterium]
MMYVISFLDRSNIGFAKEALQTSVGISSTSYALAAGLFFISYALCGFPSNLILHRIGARRWMSIITVAWGTISMAMIFVQGNVSLYVLRLLLGIAEAGFFPGVILYLTYWFPGRVRGQIMGLFYAGLPLSLIFGGPLSGFLLEIHFAGGLEGWQWMFLIEGFIALLVGVVTYWYLDDRPVTAEWMPHAERAALMETLSAEQRGQRSFSPESILKVFLDPWVLTYLAIYALIQTSIYGLIFYLPTEISALIHRPVGLTVGIVSAIPWVVAFWALIWLPRIADRFQSHRVCASVTLLIGGCAGFIYPTAGPILGVAALSIAISALAAVQPLFWTFPTKYLTDRAAAGGIAVIALGNLGGFVAPNLKVWADHHFHSEGAGFYLLAALVVLNAGLILLVNRQRRLEVISA